MKEEWLDKLQTRIQHEYDVKAPEGLLDDIKREMARRGVTPAHSSTQKHARIIPLWGYRAASVASIVAIGLYLGYILVNHSYLPNQTATTLGNKTTPASKAQTISSSINNPTPSIAKLVASIFKETPKHLTHHTQLAYVPNNTIEEGITANDKVIESQQVTNNTEQEMPVTTDNHQPTKQQSQRRQGTSSISHIGNNAHSSRFSFGTSYNATAGTTTSAERPFLPVANPYGDYNPVFAGNNIQGTEGARTHTKHHQPIKYGISVRYNVDKHWSVQTGLTYSYLSSDFSHGNEGERRVAEQKLHYVGLPINASYSFVKKNNFNVYATVGGEVEKLVKGELKQAVDRTNPALSPNTTIKEHRPVFSVNNAIGAEYKVTKDVSAYIEPGVSHHFNNGSDVENIYKAKPTNFNLNIGIRVNLNK